MQTGSAEMTSPYQRWTVRLLCAALILILGDTFLPSHARTASVAVTNGYLAVAIPANPHADVQLAGEGFNYEGAGGDQGRLTGCSPCQPGTVHSLHAYFAGSSIAGVMR